MKAAVKVTRPNTSAANSGMTGTPPFRLKPESLATSKREGAPDRDDRERRKSDDEARRNPADGRLRAGQVLSAPRPTPKHNRGDDGDDQRRREPHAPASGTGAGQEQPAIVEKDQPPRLSDWRGPGSDLQDGVIPEQQLQQQRRVAQNRGVKQRGARQEPVRRQAGDADGEAKQRRQRNADRRDKQRVQQADPEGLSVGRQGRIGDEVQVDVEARDLIPEAEAHRNAAGRHVDIGVVGAADQQRAENGDQQSLIERGPVSAGR